MHMFSTMNGIIFGLILTIGTVNSQTYSEMDALLDYLFNTTRYNKHLRPLQNQSNVIQVNISMSILSIETFDIQSGELIVTALFSISWKDEFLTWDPSLYDGKTMMPLQRDKIWKPELSQSAESGDEDPLIATDGFSLAWTTFEGDVIVVTAGRYTTRCEIDTRLFPFDRHECSYQFFISNHAASEINVYSPLGRVHTENLLENGEWKLKDVKDASGSGNEININMISIAFADYSFFLERRSTFEIINTFVPLTLMTFLNLTSCFIRPDSGERLSFAVTMYLALVFGSTALISRFPNNSLKIPYMAYRVLILNIINTASTCWSIFMVRLAGSSSNSSMAIPRRILKCLLVKRSSRGSKHNIQKVSPIVSETNDIPSKGGTQSELEKHMHIEDNNDIIINERSPNEIVTILDKIYFYCIISLCIVIDTIFFVVLLTG